MLVYLQLRWYARGDSTSWLRRDAPDIAQRKTALEGMAMGLQHMHSHGIAHGDVKLENLLISEQVRELTTLTP